MVKVTFNEKVTRKINEAIASRNEFDKKKEKNKIQLKAEMIKEIEERILKEASKCYEKENCTIEGPLYLVDEKDKRLHIRYFNDAKNTVYFEDVEELRMFIKEIKEELDKNFVHEFNVFADSNLFKVSIRFNYEYKKS